MDKFHGVWVAVLADSVIEEEIALHPDTTFRYFLNTLNVVRERYGFVPRPSKWMPKSDGPGTAGRKSASSPRHIRFADDSGND